MLMFLRSLNPNPWSAWPHYLRVKVIWRSNWENSTKKSEKNSCLCFWGRWMRIRDWLDYWRSWEGHFKVKPRQFNQKIWKNSCICFWGRWIRIQGYFTSQDHPKVISRSNLRIFLKLTEKYIFTEIYTLRDCRKSVQGYWSVLWYRTTLLSKDLRSGFLFLLFVSRGISLFNVQQ